MLSKKFFVGMVSFSIATFSTGAVFASEVNPSLGNEKNVTTEDTDEVKQSQFKIFKGEITEIRELNDEKDSYLVSVKNEQHQSANIVISNDTYIYGHGEIEVGAVITSFYDIDLPMIMIYPPQYHAAVVVSEENKDKMENIKVDLFDESLMSQDGLLKLNVSEDTEVISKNGENYEGDLNNKKLAVIYNISTKSIPAQTNPIKIIVLSEEKVDQDSFVVDTEMTIEDIIVNGNHIEGPPVYINNSGTIMVPARAIADALGLEVKWENETQTVRLGKGISFKIGEDKYIYMKTPVIQLGEAPILLNNSTYVPLTFFRDVVKIEDIGVIEGKIFINDNKIEND
jgi:hypothetical protein